MSLLQQPELPKDEPQAPKHESLKALHKHAHKPCKPLYPSTLILTNGARSVITDVAHEHRRLRRPLMSEQLPS